MTMIGIIVPMVSIKYQEQSVMIHVRLTNCLAFFLRVFISREISLFLPIIDVLLGRPRVSTRCTIFILLTMTVDLNYARIIWFR